MTGHVQQQDIQAYLAGDLRPDRLAEFEAHLDGCEACAASLTREARLEDALYSVAEQLSASGPAQRQADPGAAVWNWLRRWLFAPRGVGVASAVALTAGLALFLLTPRQGADLPPYELSWEAATAEVRGAGTETRPLAAKDGFTLLLRPQTDHGIEPQVRIYVGDRQVTTGLDVQRAPSGALRVRVEPGAAAPAAGDLTLDIAIGPSGAGWVEQPLTGGLSAANLEAGWQLLRAPLAGVAP
jgi:hypothetical protein